jgi:T5SS/PEP-CTERM-associated repeat protein
LSNGTFNPNAVNASPQIGAVASSAGTLTVLGGATFNGASAASVGVHGAGSLIVSGGGLYVGRSIRLAEQAGSIGRMVVSGDFTTVSLVDFFQVGALGNGSMLLSSGAFLGASGLVSAGGFPGGIGTISVTGARTTMIGPTESPSAIPGPAS